MEKELQQGLHEKVQGGFGRFQGTWIPLEDAVDWQKHTSHRRTSPSVVLDFSDPNLIIPRKEKPASEPAAAKEGMKKAKQAGDPPRRYKTGKKALYKRQKKLRPPPLQQQQPQQELDRKHTPNNDVCIRNISQLSATTPANVAIQGNSQIQTGQIHDVMSSQDTFNSISRQNSYIHQLPNSYHTCTICLNRHQLHLNNRLTMEIH